MPYAVISDPRLSSVVSAMNDISRRWNDVAAPERDLVTAPGTRPEDLQIAAVKSYLSGKVPDKGSRVTDLVRQYVF